MTDNDKSVHINTDLPVFAREIKWSYYTETSWGWEWQECFQLTLHLDATQHNATALGKNYLYTPCSSEALHTTDSYIFMLFLFTLDQGLCHDSKYHCTDIKICTVSM